MDITMFSSGYVLMIGGIAAWAVAVFSIRKNKPFLSVLVLLPIVLMLLFPKEQAAQSLENQQKAYIELAFQTLYHPDGMTLTLSRQEKGGNYYLLTTENGSYTLVFEEGTTNAFRLVKEEGESLRGRKNVFDVLEMTNLLQEGTVFYEEPDTYILEQADKAYTIQLKEGRVQQIVDEKEEKVVFQNEDTQDEAEEESPNE